MNITGNTKGGNTESEKTDHSIKPLKSIKNEIFEVKTKKVKTKNPAKQREESEQPVHPIKKAPKD
ncbi:hypothetical protein [Pedobacter chitinilyticus]|uniref:Uncharacterized protein n=1 Tax=Pedobacter chitinilyticus TaxID=2233776 RepID=A0A443Z0N7_9SPHI|nr:hypothetical protein [Pedobacter chitinilyticus]RWU10068.1 hypothetical protein DPV69_01620 [Pedobacter chitinilyticus]